MRWLKPTCSTYLCSVSTDSVPSLTFLFFNKDALGLFAVYLSTVATFEFHSTLWYFTPRWVDWSKLVSHPTPLGWSCTPSVSRTWSPGSSVWPQQRSESSVWTGAETPAAVSHICWKTSVLLHPPPRVPSLLYSSMFFFYLSSVRSQTNNQIDKYDNISAVLSLKANLQFLGSGSPVVPVLFPIRADQTWASWLRQTIRVSLRSLTPLCSDRGGGGGRGQLWQKEDVFLHSARRDWNLPGLWLWDVV